METLDKKMLSVPNMTRFLLYMSLELGIFVIHQYVILHLAWLYRTCIMLCSITLWCNVFTEPTMPIAKEHMKIPSELPEILKRFTRDAINTQPSDLLEWSYTYVIMLDLPYMTSTADMMPCLRNFLQ